MSEKQCSARDCKNLGTHRHVKGRISSMLCKGHFEEATKLVSLKIEQPTTGSKEADRQINYAVDCALLMLAPIIRDTIRKAIKEHVQLEPIDSDDQIHVLSTKEPNTPTQ